MTTRATCAIAIALAAVTLRATPVRVSIQGITGSAVNRPVQVTPDVPTGTLVNASNFVGLVPIVLNPVSGVVTQELLPWGYTLRVDGWPKSIHIQVPDSTNVQNAVDLVTNGVSYYPVSTLPAGVVTNGQTNVAITVRGVDVGNDWMRIVEPGPGGNGGMRMDADSGVFSFNGLVAAPYFTGDGSLLTNVSYITGQREGLTGRYRITSPSSDNGLNYIVRDEDAEWLELLGNVYVTGTIIGNGADIINLNAQSLRIGATNIYPHLTNGVVTWTTTP
jgi:hypothetical protein